MPKLRSFAFAFITLLAVRVDAGPKEKRGEQPQAVMPTSMINELRATDTHSSPRTDRRYALKNGDSFEILFPLTPDFSQSVTVQPDGYISLTSLGDLQVAGKTIPELRTLLQHSYSAILHDPIINLVVKDFEKPYFVASGELARPGKYELRDAITVTEAVAISGGFTENSKTTQVIVFRRISNDWLEVKQCDVKQMLGARHLSDDFVLQPGDMLFVPRNRMAAFRRYIPNPGLGMTVVGPAY